MVSLKSLSTGTRRIGTVSGGDGPRCEMGPNLQVQNVYIYIYMYVYIYIYIYTHTHLYIYISIAKGGSRRTLVG